tara:strand:- start:111 stop:623 length:513 start_codon:yes stop_codon:yes gene_type:complete
MKRLIYRKKLDTAYFVRDPKVIDRPIPSRQIDIEHNDDETPDVAKRRLKYKIDRGEYNFFDAVYARKVWDLFEAEGTSVPPKIVYRWYNEVLSPCLEKTKEQFTEKFYLEELLQQLSDDDKISYAKEIYNHLFKDLRKRATREPLLELPKFILKEIEKDHSLEMSYQGLL